MGGSGVSERVPLSKRLRFEVFKRDKFTCQYCGAKAPEVVLHCDHVKPVAESGGNDILNLITSCSSCNGGKGAVPLSRSAELGKQRDALADLEERRQQIEMMLEWRDELHGFSDRIVDEIERRVKGRTGFGFNENGRHHVHGWVRRFSAEEVMNAFDAALDAYLRWSGDEPDRQSWNKAFYKVPGVISISRQESVKPYLRQLFYIQGILRNRSKAPRLNRIEYLEHLHLCGASLEELQRSAARAEDFLEFEAIYDAWLARIGEPF
jgi:hypothetical protein